MYLHHFYLSESTRHHAWNVYLIKNTFLLQSNTCWSIHEVAVNRKGAAELPLIGKAWSVILCRVQKQYWFVSI